jgi:hypothetical protein
MLQTFELRSFLIDHIFWDYQASRTLLQLYSPPAILRSKQVYALSECKYSNDMFSFVKVSILVGLHLTLLQSALLVAEDHHRAERSTGG